MVSWVHNALLCPFSKIPTETKNFRSISDTDMRIQKIQTSDRGPPTPWQGLFIMYYWLCMIGLFIILSYGSHFLLIIINLDTILAAFIHSFLCDVDFLGNLCCCKKLFPQQPTVISICCFVMSFCIWLISLFTNIIKQSQKTMVILKTVYKNLIFIECLLLYIAEGQSGGVRQAGTSTSFDAGEQSIKSYYFSQTE